MKRHVHFLTLIHPSRLFATEVVPSVAKCSDNGQAASESACNELLFAASSYQKRLASRTPIQVELTHDTDGYGVDDCDVAVLGDDSLLSEKLVSESLQALLDVCGLSDARRTSGEAVRFSDTVDNGLEFDDHSASRPANLDENPPGQDRSPRSSSGFAPTTRGHVDEEERFLESFDFLTDLNTPEVIVSDVQQPEVPFSVPREDYDSSLRMPSASTQRDGILRRTHSESHAIRRQRPLSAVERGRRSFRKEKGDGYGDEFDSEFDNQLGSQAKLSGSVPALNFGQGDDFLGGGFGDETETTPEAALNSVDGEPEPPSPRLAVDTESLMSASRVSLASSNRSMDEARDDLKTRTLDNVQIIPVAGALPMFADHLDTILCTGAGLKQTTWQITRQAVC